MKVIEAADGSPGPDEGHSTVPLPGVCGGAESVRTILPEEDDVAVKVTDFAGQPGDWCTDITYWSDETVILLFGKIQVRQDDKIWTLTAGSYFHVTAGEVYDLRIIAACRAICVFSMNPTIGRLPVEPRPANAF